jgi:hypothetical protein
VARPDSRTVRRKNSVFIAVFVSAVVLAACGGSGGGGLEPLAHGSARTGVGPAAREVCNTMVRESVVAAVELPLVSEPVSAVRGDTFSCDYSFEGGALELSVRDLRRVGQARDYFRGLRDREAVGDTLSGLAAGGFTKSDGSAVAMKDAMVLTVDVTRLPPTRIGGSDVAISVAAAVLHCW